MKLFVTKEDYTRTRKRIERLLWEYEHNIIGEFELVRNIIRVCKKAVPKEWMQKLEDELHE